MIFEKGRKEACDEVRDLFLTLSPRRVPLLRVEGVREVRSQPRTERTANPVLRQGQAWWVEPAKAGLVGPRTWCQDLFPPCRPSPQPPQPRGTFQRLFMRYFLSKIWDLRRRLQRLAFSARLLSQGWARHWAALMRALGGGCGEERVGGMPTGTGAQQALQPGPTLPAHVCTGLAQGGA